MIRESCTSLPNVLILFNVELVKSKDIRRILKGDKSKWSQ